jgi:hypothetical protein
VTQTTDGDLEARLRALEHERDILRLLATYGQALDYGEAAEFLDCWTDTAVLEYEYGTARDRGETDAVDLHFEGRDQIAVFFHEHGHAPARFHKHFLVEPLVVIEGDRGRVDSYFARFDPGSKGPLTSAFGRYRDLVVRCPDGRWRFARRRGEIEACHPDRPGGEVSR